MLILLTNDLSIESIKSYLEGLDKKHQREAFGKELFIKDTVHTIVAYHKDYLLSPIIFEGNEDEVIKRWGQGKPFFYKVG